MFDNASNLDLLLTFEWQARVDLDAVNESEGAVGDEHQCLLVGVDAKHERHLRTVPALDDRRVALFGTFVLIWN